MDPQVRYLDGIWGIFSTRVYGLAGATVPVNTFGLVMHASRARSEQVVDFRGTGRGGCTFSDGIREAK